MFTVPLTLAAVFVLPMLRFDFNPLHLRDPSTEGVGTFQELLEDPGTSPYVIQIVTPNLTDANELTGDLKQLNVVDRVLTLSKFIPGDQEEKLVIIEEMSLVLDPILTPVEPLPSPSPAEEGQAVQEFAKTLMAEKHKAWELDFANSIQVLSGGLDHFEGKFHWTPEALAELRNRLIGNFPKWLDRLRKLMSASEVRFENLPQGLRDHYLAKDGRARVEVFPVSNGNDNEKLQRFVKDVQQVEPRAIGSPVAIVEGGQAIIDSCIQAASVSYTHLTLPTNREV